MRESRYGTRGLGRAGHAVLLGMVGCGLLLMLGACRQEQAAGFPFEAGPVLARVNDVEITEAFFERSYLRHLMATGANDDSLQRRLHLENLIDNVLLAQQAEAEGLRDDDYALFMAQRTKRALNDLYVYTHLIDTTQAPTEHDARVAFARMQQQRYVRHLYFTRKEEADHYYARLQAGEDFLDLANELYRTAAYDSSAGWIGKVDYFNLDDAFAEAAWALEVGAYSAPIRSRQGYHILRVEQRTYNPLPTEYGYQTRKEKVDYLTRTRRMNLDGDRFIREEMQALGVAPIPENIEQVYWGLVRLAVSRSPERKVAVALTEAEVAPLRGTLTPETPLVRYTLAGEARVFTAKDYYDWLPYLPFEEALNRTIPSVGRALRYEVFAEKARRAGLADEPWLAFDQRYNATFYLAGRLVDTLDATDFARPIPDSARAALAARLPAGPVTEADFWTVRVDDYELARQYKYAVEEGLSAPSAYVKYLAYQDTDVRRVPALAAHLQRAPLNEVGIAGTPDAWYVFQVTDRRTRPAAAGDANAPEAFARPYHYYQYVRALRDRARIEVDTTAFNALMSHFADRPGTR